MWYVLFVVVSLCIPEAVTRSADLARHLKTEWEHWTLYDADYARYRGTGEREHNPPDDSVHLGPGVEDTGHPLPPPDDDPIARGRTRECRAGFKPDEDSPVLPPGGCRLLLARHRVRFSGTRAGSRSRRAV